jgi:hypothetical protein
LLYSAHRGNESCVGSAGGELQSENELERDQ